MTVNFGNFAPFSHGIEIEQPRGHLADELVTNGPWNWHRDGSGPHETDMGPFKSPTSLFNHFRRGVGNHTWEWTAHGSRGPNNHYGCGSHLHFNLQAPEDATMEERVEAWTITYNTLVELGPFFAPFWCHNWQEGFRDNTNYSGSTSNIRTWAQPQTTRYSQDSIRRYVENERRASRNYNSVTLNGADLSGKPLTVEFRMTDAHPAFSLVGAGFLDVFAKRCIEAGWSPKLNAEAMGFNRHANALEAIYSKIYDLNGMGLIESMKQDMPVVFHEGRGIPGIEQTEFESVWAVLEAAVKSISTKTGTMRHRVALLVLEGRDEYSPSNNPSAIWNVTCDKGDFEWENGPSKNHMLEIA